MRKPLLREVESFPSHRGILTQRAGLRPSSSCRAKEKAGAPGKVAGVSEGHLQPAGSSDEVSAPEHVPCTQQAGAARVLRMLRAVGLKLSVQEPYEMTFSRPSRSCALTHTHRMVCGAPLASCRYTPGRQPCSTPPKRARSD